MIIHTKFSNLAETAYTYVLPLFLDSNVLINWFSYADNTKENSRICLDSAVSVFLRSYTEAVQLHSDFLSLDYKIL